MNEENRFEISHKWAFGMAEPKNEAQQRRVNALREAYAAIFLGRTSPNTLDAISEAKGLFSRVAKQDQWDWFTVCANLGYPSGRICRVISSELAKFRRDIQCGVDPFDSTHGETLRRLPVRKCFMVFLGEAVVRDETGAGWIYFLSNREMPDIAKIGMTTRTVEARVKEINSATGVLHPFGVRACWRVRDPAEAEILVHEALSQFRVRRDREFFRVNYKVGQKLVQRTIALSNLELRTLDSLAALAE